MKGLKLFGVLLVFLIGILMISNVAVAGNIADIVSVEIEGTELEESGITTLNLERGEDFEVKVALTASVDQDDVQVEVSLYGVHNEHVTDITGTFDVTDGVTYVKYLDLELPDRMDVDNYTLKVRVEGKEDSDLKEYDLAISSPRNSVVIKDVIFSPGDEIMQGRALLTNVRVKNMGDKEEESVKITFSVPELGISDSDYIDDLEIGDSEDLEDELYVKIPNCAEVGGYTYKVEVDYDDGDETTTETGMLYVTEGDLCEVEESAESTTLVTVGPATQDVTQGTSVIYPVTLTNNGNVAKSYAIIVDGLAEWATSSLDPAASVVLQPGESKAVYVYVSANDDASVGEHMFTLSITSGTETLEQVALKANVLEGKSGLKQGLEVGLVSLVIVLILLGLIIAFNKLKGNEDDEDLEEQIGETYY